MKNLRKITAMVLVIILMIGTIPILNVSAVESNLDFEYTLQDDGSIRLVSYIGNDIEVTIPESINCHEVTSIGNQCFFYKKLIQRIFIPKTVINLNVINDEWQVFCANINLKEIIVDAANPKYYSLDGVLYTKEKTRLIGYPVKKDGTEFIVPSVVKDINLAAFWNNKNLQKISFSGELNSIGYNAFGEMHNLKEFYYPCYIIDGVTSLLNDCLSEKIEVYISKNVISMNELDFAGSNVNLHVYQNSYGLEWAKSHEFPYVILDDRIEDEKSGINVDGINSDAILDVTESDALKTGVEDAEASYDISISNVSEEITNVKISIPASKRMLVCKKTAEGIEEIKSLFIDNKVTFEISELTSGTFVLYEPLWGDTDLDKSLDINDVTDCQRILSGKRTLSTKAYQVADFDGDGELTIKDATTVQRRIAQKY